VVDAAGVAGAIEEAMPRGGRPRQLAVRTLLVGIAAALADDRPAHLSRVHRALVGLGPADRARLGVEVAGHILTYRQVERTFASMSVAAADVQAVSDSLVEASVPAGHKHDTTAVAVDWTDYESWSRSAEGNRPAADPDASWGHRSVNAPGARGELFFGYYAQAVTMVREEDGPPVPELVRRIAMEPPCTDPGPVMANALERMAGSGVAVGDVLADSGYAHRVAERWASPLRAIGARLVQDLHPADRGPKGTFEGAVVANGNLWCPAIPPALLNIGPLAQGAGEKETAAHDRLWAEAASYKLGRLCADDADGYHRVACPAAAGKLRCPLKEGSMALGFDRPEVLSPPAHPLRCCAQATITVPPDVAAKTRQKHDYPSAAHRRSYMRRTAVERSFSTLKDPATTNMRRGWCRLMGKTKNLVMLTMATVVRNLRVLAAFLRGQADDARRAAAGQPPRKRRRRRLATPQAA